MSVPAGCVGAGGGLDSGVEVVGRLPVAIALIKRNGRGCMVPT